MSAPALHSGPETLRASFAHYSKQLSPRLQIALLVGAIGTRLYLGQFIWLDLSAFVTWIALWPLVEWLLHLKFMHFRPIQIARRTLDLAVGKRHRRHHFNPWDLSLIPTPAKIYAIGLPIV